MSRKKPTISNDIKISGEKNLKISENPNSYFEQYPSWSFVKCDLDNLKWSLNNSDFFTDIIPKLISFERRKWSDIISDKYHNHWINFEDLSKEAQNRLNELKYYYESLFSLRLTNTMRLFGYIENGIFYIIWYDPDHEICISNKKHT